MHSYQMLVSRGVKIKTSTVQKMYSLILTVYHGQCQVIATAFKIYLVSEISTTGSVWSKLFPFSILITLHNYQSY